MGDVIKMAKRWRRGVDQVRRADRDRIVAFADRSGIGRTPRGGSCGRRHQGPGLDQFGRIDPAAAPRLTHVTGGAVRMATYSLR